MGVVLGKCQINIAAAYMLINNSRIHRNSLCDIMFRLYSYSKLLHISPNRCIMHKVQLNVEVESRNRSPLHHKVYFDLFL